MAVDGSITINTNLETGDAEKDLVALHGSLKKAASAMESIGRSSQRAFESARLKVEETKLALEALQRKQSEVEAKAAAEYAGFNVPKAKRDELIQATLDTSPEYQKLQGQIERTILKLDQYTLRMERAKETSDSASASLERLRDSMSETGKEAAKTGASTRKATKDMKKMKDATIPLSKSLLTVGRVFKLMLLRMVIRATIQAVRQGFRDLAQYSAEFNRSMSALSTATLQARNSLTTAFAPALQAITPMILNAVNALVSLFNMMGMLSARVFGNATTFTKAKKAQVDYAKSVAGTNKAVKEQLAAFDELNVLTKDQGQGAEAGVPAPADMFEDVAIPGNIMTLGDSIRGVFDKAFEPLKNIDLSPIKAAFADLQAAAAPLAKKVFEGLEWGYYNVLMPLAKWTIEDALPVFLGAVSSGLDALNEMIDAVSPGFSWLWDNLLVPIANWTADVFLETVRWVKEAFGDLAVWFRVNGEKINDVIIGIGEILLWLWQKIIKPTLTAVQNMVKIVADNVKITLGGLSTEILNILKGIIDFVVGVFTLDWERAWTGVQDIFKGIWNGIVTILEGAVNLMIDAVNWLIKQLNRFQIKIPDSKIFGEWAGETWGFNISELSRFTLPRLATGAVIPPNAEFLAILGDQKHGRNIEAPEGLIRQIMREEMEGMGGSQEITIRFEGTMSQFVRSLKPYIDQEGRRRGRALIQGA